MRNEQTTCRCGRLKAERSFAAPAGSVSVPTELFEWLVEYAIELKGEWHWKRDSTRSNNEDMARLGALVSQAVALRDSPNNQAERPE